MSKNETVTESTSVVAFEDKYFPVLMQIKKMEEEKRELEEQLKKIKSQIEEAMVEYDVTSVKTSYMTILKTKGSESTSIDVKKLKEEEPDVYEELLVKYPKVTKRSGSVQFRLS